jgi:hypothetical protein
VIDSCVETARRSSRRGLSTRRVKSRYPCSGLAPVPVLHLGEGLGGVGSGGSASGVGEGAVLAGSVVPDGTDL